MLRRAVPEWGSRPLQYRITKRFLDLLIAVPIAILTLPVMAAVALAVKLDSPGPALFRQTRLGPEGPFVLRKFRTMHADAAERFPRLYNYAEIAAQAGRVPLKTSDDPRVTRLGKWLRRTSIDELPNLWNVIVGQMSVVGPRPEIPELLDCYDAEQRQVFLVKPGLTGLPQVSGRNRLTVAETIALDLEYARMASLALDLKILFRTLPAILRANDAC